MDDTLASLCLDHLRREETLLTAALPVVAAVQDAFAALGPDAFTAALGGKHHDFVKMMDDLQRQRQQFSQIASRQIGGWRGAITLSAVLARLPQGPGKTALEEAVHRVRGLAHELAARNFVVSVHVRIHLDAYRRILRDLTNTGAGSGRYGRAGRAETLDYRPMLQIHG